MPTTKPVKVEPAPLKPSVFGSGFGFPLFRLLSRELDDMFGQFGFERPFTFEPIETMWTPAVEMYTKNNELFIKADVPGLKKEDITVEVNEDTITLRGERKHEKEEKGEGFYRSERTYGSFYRTFPLPEGVKTEGAKAVVHDGVLEITMPITKAVPTTTKLEITEGTPTKPAKAA